MLNFKKNLYIASALALCALSACSSDDSSIAGSTTIPNATANNDSNSIVTNDQFTKIVFMTEATSVDSLQGGELKVFEEESGAMAACSADDKAYSSEIQIDNNKMVVTHLKLKNAGNLCEGILIRFSEACGKQAAPWAKCDENGSVETFCGDYRMTSLTKCTANNPPSCTTTEADTTITFDMLVSDFYAGVSDICNKISEGAESTSGRFEIPSSSSGKQDSEIEPSPSEEPITSSNSNPGNGDEGNPGSLLHWKITLHSSRNPQANFHSTASCWPTTVHCAMSSWTTQIEWYGEPTSSRKFLQKRFPPTSR